MQKYELHTCFSVWEEVTANELNAPSKTTSREVEIQCWVWIHNFDDETFLRCVSGKSCHLFYVSLFTSAAEPHDRYHLDQASELRKLHGVYIGPKATNPWVSRCNPAHTPQKKETLRDKAERELPFRWRVGSRGGRSRTPNKLIRNIFEYLYSAKFPTLN